jgi:hypothetical protein
MMKTTTPLWLVAMIAAAMPFAAKSERDHQVDARFPGWTEAPLPAGAAKGELLPRDARFARNFPGEIATFSDPSRTWIVRWVAQPTRKLHPSADCLRASGYAVKAGPAFREDTGELWSTAIATRGTEKWRVRERIIDGKRGSWTDISAWFWDAALGRSEGPWWATTVLEPL